MSILDLMNQSNFEIKVRAGGFYHKLSVEVVKNKLRLFFPYNPDLLCEVKEAFEGRQYQGFKEGMPKCWDIPITPRNLFRLEVMMGKYSDVKPYEQFENVEKYDLSEAIKEFCKERGFPITLYNHQVEMVNQALLARWFIWAAEMGTGKTLAAIIAMEMMKKKYGLTRVFWVGPRSALVAAKLDFSKWCCPIQPEFYTYAGLRDLAERWVSGRPAPQILILDEASKTKNPTAKQTQAAKYVADQMRQEYGLNCLIGLLTGTPAPKSPADWWSLAEIACPGFLREGHINVFRQRLAIIEKRETVPGAGQYDHIIGWRDSEDKCHVCGQLKQHPNHNSADGLERFKSTLGARTHEVHDFKPGENEVAKIKHRTRGLIGVWLKEDCLDLPEKRYEVIRVKPSRATLNAAKLIAQTAGRAIEALTLLRELSDGFQYQDVPTGEQTTCPQCKGHKEIVEYNNQGVTLTEEEAKAGVRYIWSQPDVGDDPDFFIPEKLGEEKIEVIETRVTCDKCDGLGTVPEYRRETVEVECPKDQVLIDLLERHEEVGRFNVYAGFTGSIDRIVKICHREGWSTIRVDGRGWKGEDHTGMSIGNKAEELMHIYTIGQEDHPQVVFVGQAGAAGMGLTLTASPTTFFFSNSFNGEDREQTEARGHRIGMLERGGVIIDCFHLSTDQQVYDNLKKKKDLQYMAMKGIQKMLDQEFADANV